MKIFQKNINRIEHFIIKSGNYFRTDIKYLLKGGFWLSLGQIAGAASGLAITVVLANILTEENFGSYKYLLSVYGLITAFSLSGMSTAVARATAQSKEGVLNKAVLLSLKWGLLMTAIALSIGGYYLYQGNIFLAYSLGFIALIAPLARSLALYHAFVNGKSDYKTYSLLSISNNTIPPFVLILTVLTTQNVLFIFIVYLSTQASLHLAHYLLTLIKYQPNAVSDQISIAYGKHMSFMNIFSSAAVHLDKVLVWQFLGAAPLALYAISTAIPQQLRSFHKILGTIALPQFSKRSTESLQMGMKYKHIILLCIALSLIALYWLIAPYMYNLLFPKYPDAVLYSQVFSLIFLFFPSILYQEALNAHVRTKELYIVQMTVPTLKISALLVLLPLYGLWGLIIVLLMVEIYRLILLMYFFYKM